MPDELKDILASNGNSLVNFMSLANLSSLLITGFFPASAAGGVPGACDPVDDSIRVGISEADASISGSNGGISLALCCKSQGQNAISGQQSQDTYLIV